MDDLLKDFLNKEHQKYGGKYLVNFDDLSRTDLKDGLSAFMRVRNEGDLLQTNIDSIIDCLDELIIVYNMCTDSTESVALEYQKKYPQKIKVYHYEPEVYPSRTLEHALTHPLSPHSNVNYYNFALAKTNYKYVLKHDADHFNFDSYKYIRDALTAKKCVLNDIKSIFAKAIVCFHFFSSLNSTKHYKLGSKKWRSFVSRCKIYREVYQNREKKFLALSGINIGYIEDEFKLFDSYATVGHGDYGIALRNKIKFDWQPNYQVSNLDYNHRKVFVAFTFWHARYQKRDGMWKELGSKYHQFFDPDNSYIPWWDVSPLIIPNINNLKKEEEDTYIAIPFKEKISIKDLQNNWDLVHKNKNIEEIGKMNRKIFLGVDLLPNPKKYNHIKNYINKKRLNPSDMSDLPYLNFWAEFVLSLLKSPYFLLIFISNKINQKINQLRKII